MTPGAADRPPFDPDAAHRARLLLRMHPAQVAAVIGAAYALHVTPLTVTRWESGEEAPTERELTALAGALWCSVGDLMAAPRTTREHRIARGAAVGDVALRLGIPSAAYDEMERSGRWHLTQRQAALLTEMLALPLAAHLEVTGQAGRLAELLCRAVTTRWQGYVRPVHRLVPRPRPRIEGALHHLHADYQSLTGALDWGAGTITLSPGEDARAFLDGIVEVFCRRLEARGTA
ncbi:helix-turn-helix domain-containing protein [Streptantibioticus rubrisoli]|uniref:Helix-turn-helix domain-containing protein n=1 Tax=Streptantibioticus rubrisoli TaxID=1387313 RepID=A0ABT1PM68_9ACTN|nr:helix-turn-helix transcriptional regulator [Streptantibioticus rubrisoli]MCQ4045328.1 helix-turn-helix domain-containing protein [Streptantibioticus rubrisoli]